MANGKWKIESISQNVNKLWLPYEYNEPIWILLVGCQHWDNPHSRRDLQEKHLEMAMERNAPVISHGDRFCLMQGKYDPRAMKEDIRPEHAKNNYLDAVCETAIEWHKPYAEVLAVEGKGNHELNVYKRHGSDLNDRFSAGMRYRHGSPLQNSGFEGWIWIQLGWRGTRTDSYRLTWYHTHGAGGGGPVTKGIIKTNRRGIAHDADIYSAAHIHEAWHFPIPVKRLNRYGREIKVIEHHIQVPSYKEESVDVGGVGWHIEREGGVKPVGCQWMKIEVPGGGKNKKQPKITVQADIE